MAIAIVITMAISMVVAVVTTISSSGAVLMIIVVATIDSNISCPIDMTTSNHIDITTGRGDCPRGTCCPRIRAQAP